MKTKKLLSILLALMMVLSFAACGSGSSDDSAAEESAEEFYADEGYAEDNAYTTEETASEADSSAEFPVEAPSNLPESDKIIYSANARVETKKFDESIEKVNSIIDECGGFIEYSSISGNVEPEYDGDREYRYANFILRIPVDDFKSVTENLDSLGNVTQRNTYADNISAQYRDNEARIKSLETERDRLLELLAQAQTVEDMITIEQRLSQINYEIEGLTSQKRDWDARISYSTLELNITEVSLYTESTAADISYGAQLANALSGSLKATGRFFKGFLVVLVAALPVLVILGVIALIVILIVRKSRKRKAEKMKNMPHQPLVNPNYRNPNMQQPNGNNPPPNPHNPNTDNKDKK